MIDQPILRVLAGERVTTPPVWLMRQAGRYLPEYWKLRQAAGTFLDLCYTPDLATEVTLQPIRRFDFDAAILFSDILVVPDGLGVGVGFEDGHGPILDPVRHADDLRNFDPDRVAGHCAPVYEAVSAVRAALAPEKTLIGFAGGPWTVATYAVEGGSSRNFEIVKDWMWRDPSGFGRLIDMLTTATIGHLSRQIEAGADCVQIFESWAGVLAEPEFHRYVVAPTRWIVEALRARYPVTPVIGFPRGAGRLIEDYVGGDRGRSDRPRYRVPLAQAQQIQRSVPVQGNLDPLLLVAGGPALAERIGEIKSGLAGGSAHFQPGPRHRAANPARSRCRAGCNPAGRRMSDYGGYPVQSRRADLAGFGQAVPVQPVQRQGRSSARRSRSAGCWRSWFPDGGRRSPGKSTPIWAVNRRSTRKRIARRWRWKRLCANGWGRRRRRPFTSSCAIGAGGPGPWRANWRSAESAVPSFCHSIRSSRPRRRLPRFVNGAAMQRQTASGRQRAASAVYPVNRGFVAAAADRIRDALAGHTGEAPRILFSAHGLPEKAIAAGDPYRWQVERTAAAIARALGDCAADRVVCYQSRVGPLKWIGPSTDDEIRRAGSEKRAAAGGAGSLSFRSIPKPWSNSISNIARWRTRPAFRPISGRRRSAPIPLSSRGWRIWWRRPWRAAGLASEGGGRLCPDGRSGCPLAAAP